MLSRIALLALLVLLVSCDSGPAGPPLINPNSGRISGVLTAQGPLPLEEVGLALRFTGSDLEVENVVVGRFPATASASFFGRDIQFDFSGLFLGNYDILVYSGTGVQRQIWDTISGIAPQFNGQTTVVNEAISFTGPTPFGSVAGTVTLTGAWPATARRVFIGVQPQSGPLLYWPLEEADVVAGRLAYIVGGLSYGTYTLGLFSEDLQGNITEHGTAGAQTISAAAPDLTAVDFPATF